MLRRRVKDFTSGHKAVLVISSAIILLLVLSFIFMQEHTLQKSELLIPFFFLFIVTGALYWSRKVTLAIAGVASLLSLIVMYQEKDVWVLLHWGNTTVVYMVVAYTVNRELQNSRRMQRHEQEIQVISDISSSLTQTLDLDRLAYGVIEQIFELFEADGCTIYLADEEHKELAPIAAKERRDDPEILNQILSSRSRVGFGIVGWIAATGQSVLSGDVERDVRATHIDGTPIDDESAIGVPMLQDGDTFGVLWIYRLSLNAYSEEDLQLARIFANQVSVALGNARLFDRVRRLSEMDSLTGVLNSRNLAKITEGALLQAQVTEAPVSLFFIDCDDFKHINDRFGHPVGDRYLQWFAGVLRESVREGDVIIRYAGDEFVILLPNTGLEAAIRIGERVKQKVAERTLPEVQFRMTVSVGIAAYPDHAVNAEELVKHADDALYLAKRRGKNQLAVFTPKASEEIMP